MAEASIPVDLSNPGQVFACLGFLEAADILCGDAEGGFDLKKRKNEYFVLHAAGDDNPFNIVLSFFKNAKVCALAPADGILERDNGPTEINLGIHPCRIRAENGKLRNALLPIKLTNDKKTIIFDYWCDLDSGRPILRLWTPTYFNSAFVRFTKLLEALRNGLSSFEGVLADPFNIPSPVAANFRLELRRNWTPLNLGFSPDKLIKKSNCVPIEINTYPVVEILGALGLTNARPKPGKNKLQWTYNVWSDILPTQLARRAISQKLYEKTDRCFRMYLEEPNDGGDLSIAYAEEEKIDE